jgi:hypothetical protein
MDLFALDGNTLKVYLGLVAARDTQEVYVLSHSALSRQVRLARHTVLRALHQLERGGWIQGEAGRWQVTKAPLVDLVGLPEASPLDLLDAERTEGGAERASSDLTCGQNWPSWTPPLVKIGPVPPVLPGQKLHSWTRPLVKICTVPPVLPGQKLHSWTRPLVKICTVPPIP